MYGIGPILSRTVFDEAPKRSLEQRLRRATRSNLIQLSWCMEQSFTV